MILAWIVIVSFLMVSLGLFAGATIFYVRARIERELAEAAETAAYETTRILQDRALAAQQEALEQTARAREFVLTADEEPWEGFGPS